jgi:hypothetical protein
LKNLTLQKNMHILYVVSAWPPHHGRVEMSQSMESFSTFEVMKILDITRSRLREWMNTSLVKPSIKEAKGKSERNAFSLWDLYGLAILNQGQGEVFPARTGHRIFNLLQEKELSNLQSDIEKVKCIVYTRKYIDWPQNQKYFEETVEVITDNNIAKVAELATNSDYTITINTERIFAAVEKMLRR